MPRRRLPLSIALLVVIALAGSLELVGCGSGGGSENGRGEKVMDLVSDGGRAFQAYAVASSPQGKVGLLWEMEPNRQIEFQELPASSWNWTKPEVIAPIGGNEVGLVARLPVGSPMAGNLALAYDGSGQLLAAWTANLGSNPRCNGQRWGIKARLRNRDGKWRRETLIARLPETMCDLNFLTDLQLSGGKRSFALSWPSGLRILDGNRWSDLVTTNYSATTVKFLEDGRALALWTRQDEKIVSAPLMTDGRLGKEEVLANKGAGLTVSSSPTRVIAAWISGSHIWANLWNGRAWGKAKRLVRNGSDAQSPIAVAVTQRRALVAWAQGGEWESSGYVLKKQGDWSAPAALVPNQESANLVSAATLASGEIIVLGSQSESTEVLHISASGKEKRGQIDLLSGMSQDAFSTSPAAVALARAVNVASEGEEPHLFVWIYRP